jgi:DNA-binding LacI/PurR family transcriptional regulator
MTTVAQDSGALARRHALEMAIARSESAHDGRRETIVPPKIVVRNTTRPYIGAH